MRDGTETYNYLVEKFTEEVIDERVEHLRLRIDKYLQQTGHPDLYLLNTTVLKDAVTDYFADIERLKDFQGIEKVNKNKITAYIAYWLLRHKPIQITVDQCKNYEWTYPNEEFVASLIMKDYIVYDETLCKGMPQVRQLSKFLFYFLKYRILTPQTLELFLEGVHTGVEIGKQLQQKKSSN